MTLDILHTSLEPIIQFLHNHPHYAGLITFFVVFCEAMAVIGVIIPGSITMTAIGVLAGSGVISIFSTLIWGICGGILGDYLSFLIGVHYKRRLHNMWPFKKRPQLLTYGENFIAKHGGKSIIISRSVGPMRCMIPMVAGMLKMPTNRFLFAAIPSVAIWAILYIFPGILLGALAQELPPKVATQFMLWAMFGVIVIWALIWLAQHFLKKICFFVNFYIMRLWKFLQKTKHIKWLPKFLADPQNPDNHQQLTLLILSIVSGLAFAIILVGVLTQNSIITSLNQPLYHLLHSIRTDTGDKIMLVFTMLAEPKAIFVAGIMFMCWLAWKRYWYTLIHTIAIFVLCFLSLGSIKLLAHIARPEGYIGNIKDFSFPSFHTAASISFYGFIAMIISRELQVVRWLPYTVAAIIAFVVIISRLYLGAHWLTDILGAGFLGLTLVFLITISYRKRHPVEISPVHTAVVAAYIFGAIIFLNGLYTFQKQLINYYAPHEPTIIIDIKTLHSQNKQTQAAKIPLYRTDRLGHPINAFNIQWLGDINHIERYFEKQGWENYSTRFNLHDLLRSLTIHNGKERPILPQLYNNRKEALLMTKSLGPNKPQLLLRLWDANVIISDSPYQLWLGVIDYYEPQTPSDIINLKSHHHNKPKNFIGAISELPACLNGLNWRKIIYNQDKLPIEMQKLGWNGEVIMIEE